MGNFEAVRDLILLGFGLTGAILGIVNYIELRSRTRRRIRVKIEFAIPVSSTGELGRQFVKIIATNVGHRDVTVTNLGLELPQKGTLTYMIGDAFPLEADTRMPTTLADGAIAYKYYPSTGFRESIGGRLLDMNIKVRPYADDSSGHRHYGKAKRIKDLVQEMN